SSRSARPGCSASRARCRSRRTRRPTAPTARPAEMAEPVPDLPGGLDLAVRVGVRSWRLRPGDVARIGRDLACDIRLEDPRVSRYHARIEGTGPYRRVVDLGGRNRILVNGVPADQPLRIGDGDRLTVGNTDILVGRGGLLPVSVDRSRLVAEDLGYTLPNGRD